MRQTNIGLLSLLSVVAVAGGCMPDYPSDGLRGDPAGSGDDEAAGPTADPPTDSAPAADVAPVFGATVRQTDPPPPLSGGTMAVAPDGRTIVAADPDRDRVYVVDYHDASTMRTVALKLHDEPGRVVIDNARRAHVALRRGGAFVTIDLATGTVVARRDVCSAPRGIAYDPATDVVHVACAGGELVTFPAASGLELRRRMLLRDLRDVIVVPGALIVSTFRDARTYRIADGMDVALERQRLADASWGTPAVGWRMVALPARTEAPTSSDDDVEEVLLAAQKVPASGDDVSIATPPPPPPLFPAGYYPWDTGSPPTGGGPPAPCNGNGPGPMILDRNHAMVVPDATLPVDAAASTNLIAVVAAGNGHTPSLPQLVFVGRTPTRASLGDEFRCSPGGSSLAFPGLQLTSVAFLDGETVVALSREPAALVVVKVSTGDVLARIPLAAESREDTGHAIFHANSGAGVACASCHPDGRDDGHAWTSIDLGARRTPSLLGTLAGTAPYHWNGEARDLNALMQLTFESRMRGPALTDDRLDAVGSWLRELAAPPAATPLDAAAASRGKALFEGAGRCSTCHSGAMRTNNATLDVGTGGAFQVPSLVGVSWRPPYLHDGSAPTVRALLQRAHGGGNVGASQISDLDTYVGTF